MGFRNNIRKNGNKYLPINENEDVLKKYEQVLSGIKYYIEKTDNSDSVYEKDYMKIKFNTDNDVPLGKVLYLTTTAVIITCVFKKDGKCYPQVYLDDCLYQV